jgi:XTP/dITP diphosphohydrolase
MELIFASHNDHKLTEVRASLGSRYTVTSLASLGWTTDISETEDSLVGNALIKARTVSNRWGRNCFADDTGLEIEALGGRPGVYTARFAGDGATAKQNREKTLRLMAVHENRRARFRTVIALLLDGCEYTFEGQVGGEITWAEHGSEGFGYDAIFKPFGFGKTYAEMPLAERVQLSHRALAIAQLREFLDRYPSPSKTLNAQKLPEAPR